MYELCNLWYSSTFLLTYGSVVDVCLLSSCTYSSHFVKNLFFKIVTSRKCWFHILLKFGYEIRESFKTFISSLHFFWMICYVEFEGRKLMGALDPSWSMDRVKWGVVSKFSFTIFLILAIVAIVFGLDFCNRLLPFIVIALPFSNSLLCLKKVLLGIP